MRKKLTSIPIPTTTFASIRNLKSILATTQHKTIQIISPESYTHISQFLNMQFYFTSYKGPVVPKNNWLFLVDDNCKYDDLNKNECCENKRDNGFYSKKDGDLLDNMKTKKLNNNDKGNKKLNDSKNKDIKIAKENKKQPDNKDIDTTFNNNFNDELSNCNILLYSRNIYTSLAKITLTFTPQEKTTYLTHRYPYEKIRPILPLASSLNLFQLINRITGKMIKTLPVINEDEYWVLMVLKSTKKISDVLKELRRMDSRFMNLGYCMFVVNKLVEYGIVKRYRDCLAVNVSNEALNEIERQH